MDKGSNQTLHKRLGSNNLLLVVADGYTSPQDTATPSSHCLAALALTLADRLNAYAVVNAKYKKEIMDLADIRAVRSRPRVLDAFLGQIKQFKDEIAGNGLLPLMLVLQVLPASEHPEEMLLLGYGQGERGVAEQPHRPTLSPSLLTKIRMAIEDQHLRTGIAPTNSPFCGRESHHLNQLFRQKEHLDGFLDALNNLRRQRLFALTQLDATQRSVNHHQLVTTHLLGWSRQLKARRRGQQFTRLE